MSPPVIYVYEDDPAIRELLVSLLVDELDAQVVASNTIAATRRLAEAEPPDVIVADFWGTSHLSLSEAERAEVLEVAQLAPLILVCARAWAADMDAADLGILGLQPKPLDMDRFLALLRAALDLGAEQVTCR